MGVPLPLTGARGRMQLVGRCHIGPVLGHCLRLKKKCETGSLQMIRVGNPIGGKGKGCVAAA